MPTPTAFSLTKEERICSKKLINDLFSNSKSRSMTAFPLRAVFMRCETAGDVPPLRMLASVPKRYFKHAVERNRVKRQIREAFRKNKAILANPLTEKGEAMAVAFIWIATELHSTANVERKTIDILQRIKERL